MPQATTLTRIGSNIKVNLETVRDRIPSYLLKQLKVNPRGKVLDYKMTDGTGIGVIVQLNNGSKSWFFEDEISKA